MLQFPSMCRFSERERDGMPPVKRYAAMVGCPEKYLYLTQQDYHTPESYGIHRYQEMQVKNLDDSTRIIEVAGQLDAAKSLVPFLFGAETGTLTVINGYPSLQETYLLLWHLVCHFSAVKFSNPIKYREFAFSFIGNFKLEGGEYHTSKYHTLAFGPALDEMNSYHVSTYVDTMMRFDDVNKILITSTPNLTALLEKIRVVPKHVRAFINLSERIVATPEAKPRRGKPPRQEKMKKFVESI